MSKTAAKRRVVKGGAALKKQDEPMPEDTEDSEDDGEEGDEDMENEEKSDLSTSDLRKSLATLEAIAKDETPTSKKEALLAKAMREALSDAEREELFVLMGGGADPNTLGAQVNKAMDSSESEILQKSIDVSDFLAEFHNSLSKALQTVADGVEKGQTRQHEFNVVLAKSVLEVGNNLATQAGLLKALAERIGVVEARPARAPKAQIGPMEKSFAGQPANGELSKSQVLDILERMMLKSDEDGRGGVAQCGEDLLTSIAKYENDNKMSKALYAEVINFHRTGRAVR